MSPVDVREIDPNDDAMLRAWWEVGRDAEAERPLDLWWPWEEARLLWTLPPVDRLVRHLGAFSGREMVGTARIVLPLKDNAHLGFVEVYVPPDRRRRGIGRALVEAYEAIGAEHGRSAYLGDVFVAPGQEGPGTAFAAALDYDQVALEVMKVADLPATEHTWAPLAAEADAKRGDYRLLDWVSPTPDEHVAGVCDLYSRFLGEIPLEDMALHPTVWDEDRLRRAEERRARAGFDELMVVAQAPDGALVGYTNCVIGRVTNHRAAIDGTLVLPEHRGHALGLALKVRLHEQLRARFPDCKTVLTGNAGVNAHMNAVNDRLGYEVVEHNIGVQKTLPPATSPTTT